MTSKDWPNVCKIPVLVGCTLAQPVAHWAELGDNLGAGGVRRRLVHCLHVKKRKMKKKKRYVNF